MPVASKKLLDALSSTSSTKSFLIGFDGFTDEIIDVVSSRHSIESYEPFATIRDFGERILASCNESANIELVSKQTKIGGNAPILSNALLKQGHRGSFIGAIGTKGHIEPLFQEMASQLDEVIALGPSAHSDAFEFQDGKLIMGKHQTLKDIHYKGLLAQTSKESLIKLFSDCFLFGNTNWTMLLGLNDLWEGLIKNILPHLPKKTRCMFIDLCDPTKRAPEELSKALSLIGKFSPWFNVILGLNNSEAHLVANVLGIKQNEDLGKMAASIREKTSFSQVVVHTKKIVFAALETHTERFEVPFCTNPVISTGAGDNFNAGYCSGLLLDLPPSLTLEMGALTAGFYIRKGFSPSLEELKSPF